MIERPRSQWTNRGPRNPTSVSGIAYRGDGSWLRVHMVNLSYNGCRLLTENPVDIGETLTLIFPRMQHLQVQVRWVGDHEVGVRFPGSSSVDERRSRIGV